MADDDHGLATVLIGRSAKPCSDSLVHLGPRLHSGKAATVWIIGVAVGWETFAHADPSKAFGVAGMDLAEVTLRMHLCSTRPSWI